MNDFQPLATGGSANVITQAAYLAQLASALANGLESGILPSNLLNKILRQSSFVSAATAQFMCDNLAINIPDDGNLPTFEGNFASAVRGAGYAGAAGGTANAITAALSPAPSALLNGLQIEVVVAAANSGAVTLNLNSLGAKAVLRSDGSALQAGDLIPGMPLPVFYNGTAFLMLTPGYGEIPRNSQAAVTLYVRTDGNDNNNGSANGAGSAFLTIQAAINYGLNHFQLSGRQLTIQLGNAGTYAPFTVPANGGTIVIAGDIANQDNYLIQGAGAPSSAAMNQIVSSAVLIKGVKLDNTGTATSTIASSGGGNLTLQFVTFNINISNGNGHLYCLDNSTITINDGCKVLTGCNRLMYCQGGVIACVSGTLTLVGSPIFSFTVISAENGRVRFSGFTWSGAAGVGTTRYNAILNGVINTSGAGASYIPGANAGTTATGGQYA